MGLISFYKMAYYVIFLYNQLPKQHAKYIYKKGIGIT